MQDYAVHLLKTLDKNNESFVDVSGFCDGLKSMNIFISKHEAHSLLRTFDKNGDGKVSMEDFYNALAA